MSRDELNLATFRVEGDDSALAALVKALGLDLSAEWKRGVKKRNGELRESSGFNARVADASSSAELVGAIRSFFVQCKEKNLVFPDLGLSVELAIGFTVGGSEQFVAGVELSPADLRACAELGITLSVVAYPASDEDE